MINIEYCNVTYTNIHVAPILLLSYIPPIARVFPYAESDTLVPCLTGGLIALLTINFLLFKVCWTQFVPEYVNIHVEPLVELSPGQPIARVFPIEDKDTEVPWDVIGVIGVILEAINFVCWDHVDPFLVNIQVAPIPPSSSGPPTARIFPFADNDTDVPCWERPILSVPITCCCSAHGVPLGIPLI